MSHRIGIVDYEKCKPNKCNKECTKKCPPNQIGKKCIYIEDVEEIGKKAIIANNLCIGCGACAKVCPFNAIQIVNLPHELTKEKMLISYGENSFRVYMRPHLKKGYCMGIIGSNGLGKTSIIGLLSGETNGINIKEKKRLLVGSETYSYLEKLYDKKLRVSYKPQDIAFFNRTNGDKKVHEYLDAMQDDMLIKMELKKLSNRTVNQLSGGETQRLLISIKCAETADSYLFDEPTAFLDIKQRITASQLIREKCGNAYLILIEHDLCIFDYVSDYVTALYGKKGAYGVISSISTTLEGINNYLEGWLPAENIKFRDKPIRFRYTEMNDEIMTRSEHVYGPYVHNFNKSGFNLEIERGTFSTSEITLLIGENGTGKTTMIHILAGLIVIAIANGSEKSENKMPELSVSIKKQNVYETHDEKTFDFIYKKIGNMMYDGNFKNIVINPLDIEKLYDLNVNTLSGGQMQRVAITVCLGKPADLYLLDEPSAYIDIEDRITISRILKQFIFVNKKSMFLVEHDLIMATCTCDKVIVFTGEPGLNCKAMAPTDIKSGINTFLSFLGVTMRKDKNTGRPRINKMNSQQDQEQKKNGQFFMIE
jgi:ATP-binding cassette, sub-family E, member 1